MFQYSIVKFIYVRYKVSVQFGRLKCVSMLNSFVQKIGSLGFRLFVSRLLCSLCRQLLWDGMLCCVGIFSCFCVSSVWFVSQRKYSLLSVCSQCKVLCVEFGMLVNRLSISSMFRRLVRVMLVVILLVWCWLCSRVVCINRKKFGFGDSRVVKWVLVIRMNVVNMKVF